MVQSFFVLWETAPALLRGRADYPWPNGRRLAVYFPLNLEHFPTAKASVRIWCQMDRSSTFSTSRGAIMAAFADMIVDCLSWRESCQSHRRQR